MEKHRILSIMDIFDVYGLEREEPHVQLTNKKYKFNILEYETDIHKLFDRFFYMYNTQIKMFDINYNRNNTKTMEIDFICIECYNSKGIKCDCEGTNIDIVQVKFNNPFNTKFNILFNETKFELSENFETSILSIDILNIIERDDNDVLKNQFKKLLRLFLDFTEINTIEEGKIKLQQGNKYLCDRLNEISDKEFNFNYIDKYMIYLF